MRAFLFLRTLVLGGLCAALGTACPATTSTGRRERPLSAAVRAQIGLPGPDAPAPEKFRAHFIDVGQGTATLFEFPCAAILIDTGGEQNGAFDSTQALVQYLDAFFARRVDLNRTLATLFLSHAHLDHTRGVQAVLQHFTVQHVVTNGRTRLPNGDWDSGGEQQFLAEEYARSRGTLRTVSAPEVPRGGVTDEHIDAVACGAVDPKISVMFGSLPTNALGWEDHPFANANNHSVVVKVEVDGRTVLMTGDLEDEGFNALVDKHQNSNALDVEIYGVSHHGSANGTNLRVMRAMTACVGVVSMGDWRREEDWTAWKFGHPRVRTVRLVMSGLTCPRPARDVRVGVRMKTFEGFTLDKALYGTGWEGTVLAEPNADGTWKMRTER